MKPDTTTTTFTISADHPCFVGHFPGHPIVPGVVVLDRVQSAAESLMGFSAQRTSWPQVKFLRPLGPGEEARIDLFRETGSATPRLRFKVHRGEELLAAGEFAAVDAE